MTAEFIDEKPKRISPDRRIHLFYNRDSSAVLSGFYGSLKGMGIRLLNTHVKLIVLTMTLLTLYCSAATALGTDPTLPPQGPFAFDVQANVFIEMRDGTRLATDLYIPKGRAGSRHPIILIRTPYGDFPGNSLEIPAAFFASHGYVVAIQDKRGKFRSEGTYLVSGGDDKDGYDTIDWLSRQSWSNGKVGMYGCSYSGDIQIFAAQTKPPALKAMIPQASGSAAGSIRGLYRYFGTRVGGANEWADEVGWFSKNGGKIPSRLPTSLENHQYTELYTHYYNQAPKIPAVDFQRAWRHLPMVDALRDQGFPDSDFADNLEKSLTDSYWDQLPYMTDAYTSDVPTLFVNSWYDFGVDVTLMEYNWFREHSVSQKARDNQYAIISPGTHCSSETDGRVDAVVGSREIGDTRFDYWQTYLTWFDYWLKDEDTAHKAVDAWPKLRYYTMGANRWESADSWPPRNTHKLRLFLASHGRANSLFGDGILTASSSTVGAPSDSFTYNPDNPVPSLGGAMCCTHTVDALPGAQDQRPIESRDDVLVYTTEPLTAAIVVTGDVDVTLFASSSAVDTDFTAKLIDIYPDGRAFNILESILRARYREGFTREVWMEKGKIYRVHIPVGTTSNSFGIGHQIRLEISSSNFPRFDRNLNVGGNNARAIHWITATNQIYHSSKYQSQLELTQISQ